MIEGFYEMNRGLLQKKSQMISDYRKDCITLGQEISVVRNGFNRHGKALDVDEDGALLVAYEDGSMETVNSGEVSVRGLYNYV